jgi:hypothetical protein
MNTSTLEAKNYLLELHKMTTGDVSAQVSMFDVGSALGLEKDVAGKIAEDLIGRGLVEVKTLSGGIGITDSGVEEAQAAGGGGPVAAAGLNFGTGPVLEESGREAVSILLKDIQTWIGQHSTTYAQVEEMIIDIKTIEVQMLSPNPKTATIREVFRSLHSALKAAGSSDLTKTIDDMTAD